MASRWVPTSLKQTNYQLHSCACSVNYFTTWLPRAYHPPCRRAIPPFLIVASCWSPSPLPWYRTTVDSDFQYPLQRTIDIHRNSPSQRAIHHNSTAATHFFSQMAYDEHQTTMCGLGNFRPKLCIQKGFSKLRQQIRYRFSKHPSGRRPPAVIVTTTPPPTLSFDAPF
jgi:hypothetical protein